MRRGVTAAAVALLATVGSAEAASRFVASNGVDSATCGGSGSPCRSIGQAITNANDGDYIRVGPGHYSPSTEPSQGGCDCLIFVDKAVKIEATEGAGATILDAAGEFEYVVVIDSGGVIFGLDHKGFTIVGGTLSGVYSLGNDDVEVHSNRVIGIECGPGFVLAGTDVLATYNEAHCNGGGGFVVPSVGCALAEGAITKPTCGKREYHGFEGGCFESSGGNVVRLLGNQAVGNDGPGFDVDGTIDLESNLATGNSDSGFAGTGSLQFKFNAATANAQYGFSAVNGTHKYDRNVASGNIFYGFGLFGGIGHLLEQNSVVGNSSEGVFSITPGTVLTKNNIYGNDVVANCGVQNSGPPVSATKNYWGAATGPGADPADSVCGPNVTTSPWLPGPTAVPYLTGAGGSP